MAAIGKLLFLVLFAGALASPDAASRFAFPEDVRGPGRIVSGWEAEDRQIPYQLSLRMVNAEGGVSACGATVISNEWALTAAHCTATRVSLMIRAGTVNLTRPAAIFDTTEYYNHPLYNEQLQSIVQPHDIGVIKFNRFLEFNSYIQPIRLQSSLDKDRNYQGLKLQASGWGRTWTNGASPENLNFVYLIGESNDRCRTLYGGSSTIIDSTICANAYNVSSQSTCQGDSGGPLVVLEEDGIYTQVGVSSFVSSSGCHTDFPAGFIRPGHYHEWLEEITKENYDTVPAKPTTSAPETEESQSNESSDSSDSSDTSESSESSESSSSESQEEEDPTKVKIVN